uniref:Chemokine interleukin-8-like domain-containing protein n=1 Tax=Hucho hucho TaxID=62062 RepID=A0A4W5LVX9_9TELE
MKTLTALLLLGLLCSLHTTSAGVCVLGSRGVAMLCNTLLETHLEIFMLTVVYDHLFTAVIKMITATECCINFRAMIPLKQVVSVRTTSSSCPHKALIFTTKTGKTFCVDPSEAWVQSHVTKIESRQR